MFCIIIYLYFDSMLEWLTGIAVDVARFTVPEGAEWSLYNGLLYENKTIVDTVTVSIVKHSIFIL